MTDRIHAPWSEAQIAALNAYQRSGRMHPFTCGNEQHELHQTLIAERDGWRCPDEQCDYRQTWAHAFMGDPAAIPMGAMEQLAALQAITQPGLAAELRKTREQLRATETQLGEQRRLNQALRNTTDTVPVPRRAFEQLVQVAEHVSVGKSFAFHQEKPYPDATARFALGALGDAGLHPLPDSDGGVCDPTPHDRPTTVAGSIDNWQETT